MDNNQHFYSGTGSGSVLNAIGSGQSVGLGRSTPTAEIHDANDELGKEIAGLHECLANLESCLSPILRPAPQPNHDSAGSAGSGVPLADLLRGYSHGIAVARWRINALLENIAL